MNKLIQTLMIMTVLANLSFAYYTTNGQNIVDRTSGEIVQLRGIGLGGWLLPEGYMWGIRKLDRPRQFEAAIIDLIGEKNAKKFWRLYHENFVTRQDVVDMKSWGVNTLRIPLLASMLQPRENQPDQPPYHYDADAFSYLDNLVDWCEALEMGIIWDLHGAPGGQNAANISDSDGEARLWTEKDKYWPLTIDLWDTITRRYADKACIVGYDLLNEPLLARYPGVDPGMLRELYVLTTERIRETDTSGIIFVEGDEWAQDFSALEPLDWDPHLVLAFHSYPPSSTQNGIQRWDDLRNKYDIPLWHGETGEQDPPWEIYKRSTEFLEQANIGWNWWTHKKFELYRQPWSIHRSDGFNRILDYWKGKGERPSKWQAKRWLFEQARQTNSKYCEFMPGMVESLRPLDPSEQVRKMGVIKPEILSHPQDLNFQDGFGASLKVKARGYPRAYQWYRNGEAIEGADDFQIYIHSFPREQRAGNYHVLISNSKGSVQSDVAKVSIAPFSGYESQTTAVAPVMDGEIDSLWESIERLDLKQLIGGKRSSEADLGGWGSLVWDKENLYLLVNVYDDILSSNAKLDYMKDGIEIYLDTENTKSAYYGDHEFQIRSVFGKTDADVTIGHQIDGIITAQSELSDGYIIEMAIPWSGLKVLPESGDLIGLDIHINDNDSATRDGKLAWWTVLDKAYQNPSVFGTIRLK